mgnify:CR=1 FL=1
MFRAKHRYAGALLPPYTWKIRFVRPNFRPHSGANPSPAMTTAAMPAATARLAPAPAHAPAPLPHSAQTFGGLGGLGGRAVSDVPRNPDSPSRRSHHTSISSRPSSYQVQAQAQARAQAQTQVQAQLSQPQSPFSSPHLHSQPHSAAFESAHLDYRQLVSSSNYNHSTSHYQSTNAHNQSHGGAAQHHHHQHRPHPEQPYRQQQDQPQQLNNHRRTQPSTRPIHEVLPHDDYETSQLARNPSQSHPRPGAASRDRPPVSSRAYHPETSRQYNRSIGKPDTNPNNNHNYRPQLQNYSSDLEQPDMAPSATHGGHSGGDGTQHSSSTKQSRSRTTIPTQSGKWILGKTIGAGSMGKVKLARKEDGSEQVCYPDILVFRFALDAMRVNQDHLFRSPAKSSPVALPTMVTSPAQTRSVPTSPRKFALPARQPSSHFSTTLTSAVSEMSFEQTITGTCSSSMLMAARCSTT